MTSRRGGSEGYKSPPSPPSSGSEDNGFTNRPRVAGLYVKNLSREELDELAKEGIYGPTGNPNDRPRDSGSQRSLNIPGSSRDLDGQNHLRGATSRTPQPLRRSGLAAKHREPGLSETLTRRDHHGSLPMERGWSRRSEDRPGQASSERSSARGSSEFPAGWRESFLRPSPGASPRGSSIDVRITGEDPRVAAGPRRFGEVPKCPEALSPGVPSSTEQPSRDQEQSPPPYTGLSPPKYTEYEEPSSRPAKICPKTATRIYKVDDKERPSSPYERPSPPLLVQGKEYPQPIAKSSDSRTDTSKTDGVSSPSETEKLTSPESKKSESPPMKRIGSRTQDSMRLRPPLAGTAGTSADSGTGDSGSAEIQADIVTPQAASANVLDNRESKMESRSSGARTPGSKGGKQTVKPFTKESKLENRTVQLVRDYGYQPKRKMSVEDGAILPNKFEPFPNNLYGRPLEEIDNFIYDEVSSQFRAYILSLIHSRALVTTQCIFRP